MPINRIQFKYDIKNYVFRIINNSEGCLKVKFYLCRAETRNSTTFQTRLNGVTLLFSIEHQQLLLFRYRWCISTTRVVSGHQIIIVSTVVSHAHFQIFARTKHFNLNRSVNVEHMIWRQCQAFNKKYKFYFCRFVWIYYTTCFRPDNESTNIIANW